MNKQESDILIAVVVQEREVGSYAEKITATNRFDKL